LLSIIIRIYAHLHIFYHRPAKNCSHNPNDKVIPFPPSPLITVTPGSVSMISSVCPSRDEGPGVWDQAIAKGLKGLQTDHPAALVNYLKEKGLR
jgi:hypothetical protein